MELLGQPNAVEGMECRSEADEIFHLVGLEVADDAPADGQILEQGLLVTSLLQLVLPELGNPGGKGEPEDMSGNSLGDGQQVNVTGFAPGAATGVSDALLDSLKVFGKRSGRIVAEACDVLRRKVEL